MLFWCFLICMKTCKNDGNKVDMRQDWTKCLPWKIMKNYVEKKKGLWPEKVIILLLLIFVFFQIIFKIHSSIKWNRFWVIC